MHNNRLDTWQGEARWRDADECRPREYTGIRYGNSISWRGAEVDESTLRIAVSRNGSGGQSLWQWMPVRTNRIHILVTRFCRKFWTLRVCEYRYRTNVEGQPYVKHLVQG